ncbi:MAG: ribose-5-phosphate isomerase RpiA [Parachlamydiales bacterium]|jgi:ribose 5-phosphate isomerase A
MESVKDLLGETAANLVKNNDIVGLGTGSTANHFIKHLAKRCTNGLSIKAIASSMSSFQLARSLQIPLIDYDKTDVIDIYVDGADQVDEKKQMIKGLGGALLREKILAVNSKKRIIMIEQKKLVPFLGNCILPVEIVQFGYPFTKKILQEYGYNSNLRRNKDSSVFLTDNNNYILDITLPNFLHNPKNDHQIIKNIPGIVETGLFIDICDAILIGSENQKIQTIS